MKTKLTLTLLGSMALLLAPNLDAQTTPGPQPSICVRSCWGARAPNCSLGTLSSLTRAIIHHTAGNEFNTTGLASSQSYMRGIQNYDMDVNGWCDFSYHFTVDKFGNLFEGRSGAMTGLPRAIHDTCNTAFGFTLLGYFHPPRNNVAPQIMLDRFYDVLAWRMPSGWSPYGSGTYCGKTVGVLDGHRKVTATACPGDLIHPNLITENYFGGTMRNSVAARRNGGTENASFVSKTVANGTTFAPGQAFSCGYTMNNNGTVTWIANGGNGHTFNYLSGTQMGAPTINAPTGNVAPGQNYTFNINFTAPTTPGSYTVTFQMNNPAGVFFGAQAALSITVSSTEVIVDNSNAGFSVTGTSWATGSSSTDKYGADYRYRGTAPISEPAQWTGNLTAGTHTVYAWWAQGSNRSTTAPYHVTHAGGTTVVSVNQQINGGGWRSLGSWSMNAGNNVVKLSCWTATGYIVLADAIKWQ